MLKQTNIIVCVRRMLATPGQKEETGGPEEVLAHRRNPPVVTQHLQLKCPSVSRSQWPAEQRVGDPLNDTRSAVSPPVRL